MTNVLNGDQMVLIVKKCLKHFIYDLDGLKHFKTIFNVFLISGPCLNNSKHLKKGFKQVTTVLNGLKCFECVLTG